MKIVNLKMNRYVARISIFWLTIALIVGMVGVSCTQTGGGGGGATQIRTWTDLDAIRNNLSGSYLLMNDLNSTTAGYGGNWQPIGTSDNPFTGTFDGQYYQIKDLIINRPAENNVGLFGCSSGTIKNVPVMGATVSGHLGVCALVAVNNGAVINCASTGTVNGYESVGGLVGYNNGTVSGSSSAVHVASCTLKFAGGLVGYSDTAGMVSNCYAGSEVDGNDIVGGLVGYNDGTVINSYSLGKVNGMTNVGGLLGACPGTVTGSFWNTVTSGMGSSAGGAGAMGMTPMDMMNDMMFMSAGWDIVAITDYDTPNTSHIWNIYQTQGGGGSNPMLSWILTTAWWHTLSPM